MFLPNIIKIC